MTEPTDLTGSIRIRKAAEGIKIQILLSEATIQDLVKGQGFHAVIGRDDIQFEDPTDTVTDVIIDRLSG